MMIIQVRKALKDNQGETSIHLCNYICICKCNKNVKSVVDLGGLKPMNQSQQQQHYASQAF